MIVEDISVPGMVDERGANGVARQYLVRTVGRDIIQLPLTQPVALLSYQIPAVENGQQGEQQAPVLVIRHSASIVALA